MDVQALTVFEEGLMSTPGVLWYNICWISLPLLYIDSKEMTMAWESWSLLLSYMEYILFEIRARNIWF